MATLIAAIFLNPLGRIIDRVAVNKMVIINTGCFVFGCLLLVVAGNTYLLFFAFIFLRLFGQGVFILTATTSFANHFNDNRGRAGSILAQGYPFSEFILPGIFLLLLNAYGWRYCYVFSGVALIFIYLPLSLFALKKSNLPDGYFTDELNNTKITGKNEINYNLKDALRDIRFYLMIIAACIPPIIMTALLFHQEKLFMFKSWPVEYIVYAISSYALTKFIASLIAGQFVDKYGPTVFHIFIIILISLAPIVYVFASSPNMALVYFAIMGFALGVYAPISAVIWPALYGPRHLGSLKGFVSTFRNGLTALGPVGLALIIENNYSISRAFILISAIILILAFIPYLVYLLSPTDIRHKLMH